VYFILLCPIFESLSFSMTQQTFARLFIVKRTVLKFNLDRSRRNELVISILYN
jgi:hypothetical protein